MFREELCYRVFEALLYEARNPFGDGAKASERRAVRRDKTVKYGADGDTWKKREASAPVKATERIPKASRGANKVKDRAKNYKASKEGFKGMFKKEGEAVNRAAARTRKSMKPSLLSRVNKKHAAYAAGGLAAAGTLYGGYKYLKGRKARKKVEEACGRSHYLTKYVDDDPKTAWQKFGPQARAMMNESVLTEYTAREAAIAAGVAGLGAYALHRHRNSISSLTKRRDRLTAKYHKAVDKKYSKLSRKYGSTLTDLGNGFQSRTYPDVVHKKVQPTHEKYWKKQDKINAKLISKHGVYPDHNPTNLRDAGYRR